MLVSVPYTQIIEYSINNPVTVIVDNKGISLCGVIKDGNYEINVVVNNNVYFLYRCSTEKEIMDYLIDASNKINSGAKIVITSKWEAKIVCD